MWYAALVRFIRRRLVLGLIFVSSLTYCIVSLLKPTLPDKSSYQESFIERKQFVWRTLQEHNDTVEFTCRNSIQGRLLIVDDRGYVCRRSDITKNGCCDIELEKSKRYTCETCNKDHCCVIYENCVSCCLEPSKRNMLKAVLSKLSTKDNILFRSVSDDYELCIAMCRTSSHSVLHENAYRNPTNKYCFGEEIAEDPPT